MVEITCDQEQEAVEVKLPKNLRQVGAPPYENRIYMEDYVVTYLNYIARPGNIDVRGAILLGEKKKTEHGDAIFISGAVDAQCIEFDMEECHFTDEAWAEIYEQINDNFPKLSIVGWFLSRMGFSTAINERIEKLHVENFPGSDKVLYVSDSLESEDAFYMYQKGQMVKQKGYYIYYSRNDDMQNYIIKKRGEEISEENSDIKRKDDELIKLYRDKSKSVDSERTESVNLVYAAGVFMSLLVVGMGVTIAGNYKKMKNMEVSINRLELTSDATNESVADADGQIVSAPAQEVTVIPPEEMLQPDVSMLGEQAGQTDATTAAESVTQNDENITEPQDAQADNVAADTHQESETATSPDNAASEGTVNDEPASTSPVTFPCEYNVKYGDTLSSIAREYYGSIEFVDEIATKNNMGPEDTIYENQKLVLPLIP